ncbi:hypothetical protein B0J14DRAFT_594738 [Halenospora varia]|nr:hypothetical protein B0J14DRAFT_594738 [Halenospora varia]
MDPLSIATAVINVCDSLYHDVKKRPKLLKDLLDDLNCLVSVLEELKNSLSEKHTGEEAALRKCLDGCHDAIKNVHGELDAVRALFEKNIVVKAYAQLTFKTKMGAIMESRERVDRFTSVVSVALAVRQHVSTKIVHSKLDKLAVEIFQTKKDSSQPAMWLDPLRQYVDASFAVLTKSDSSSASSAGITSSSTLVDEGASASTSIDTDAIASFGSFDDWLESFAQEEDKDSVQPVAQDNLKIAPAADLAQTERTTFFVGQKVELFVDDLPVGSHGSSRSQTQTLSLSLSNLWDDALKLLQEKGYRKICGFRLGSTFLTPLASHIDDVHVTVTEGPSTYSMSGGLRINLDEPLELYFDNFVRVGETGQSVQPLNLFKMSDEGKIVIVDHFGDSSKKVEIALSRTLRVPEDGTVYNPPVLMSPFPLINAEELALDRLPQLRKKGGLLIPLWQREALALTFSGDPPKYRYTNAKPSADFAIKIYAGSVNVISGAINKRSVDDAQDYVIAPVQNRLDGYLLRAGIVKQFVSMPLGAGYTAEGQITGQELLGGLQVLIAPRFRARGTFRSHENQRKTPRELDLKVGDRVFMAGEAVTSRAREFRYGEISTYFTGDGCVFHRSAEARPLFVHEMLFQSLGLADLNKPLSIEAVLPYKLDIVVRQPKEYVSTYYRPAKYVCLRKMRCSQAQLPQEYSPFLGANDLAKALAELLAVTDVILTDGVVLYCQGYAYEHLVGAAAERELPKAIEPKKELQWEMGLAPGGEIKQAIVPDPEPLDWNWARARLVNVQILNSVVFEAVTGIVPPPPPISFKDYLKAKLPFFHLIGDETIAAGKALSGLQSVGQRDAEMGVQLQSSISKSKKTVGCVVCEENLADSVLRPCMHVFCGLCVRDHIHDGDKIRCAACRKLAKEVVSFGAPMEMPLVGGRPQVASPVKGDEHAPGAQESKVEAAAQKSANGVLIQPASHLQKLALSGRKDANLEIDALLAEGCGHNEPVAYENGRTAMQIAASIGNANLLTKLLAAGISVDEASCAVNGRTALQAAAERGDGTIVTRLLAAGADPNAPVSLSGGWTALEAAAKSGHLAILALLLQHGASSRSHPTHRSALHLAAENGNEAAVALLLAYGFEPDARSDLSEEGLKLGESWSRDYERTAVSPSDLAAEKGHLGVLKVLRSNGAKSIPISTACAYGNVKIVDWLLEIVEKCEAEAGTIQMEQEEEEEEEEYYSLYRRRYLKTVDDHGYPYRKGFEGKLDALMETAAKHGQVEVLKMLVKRGALLRIPGRVAEGERDSEPTDKEAPDKYFGSTLLHEAAKSGSADSVAYLLSLGFALEESRVYRGKTPLMEAAEAGQFGTFNFLVAKGANIHAADNAGRTVTIVAARSGSEDILRLLFRHNVDVTKIGPYSESALSASLSEGHESVASLLLEQLDKQKHKSGYNACLGGALRVAAEKAQLPVVRELLKRGADPNFDTEGRPYGALYHLGTFVREETNEDDCLECARLLVTKGGKYRGKLRMAAFFGGKDVEWVELIMSAAKKGEAGYKDGQAFIPWDISLSIGFDAAVDSGQLEIRDARRYCGGDCTAAWAERSYKTVFRGEVYCQSYRGWAGAPTVVEQ